MLTDATDAIDPIRYSLNRSTSLRFDFHFAAVKMFRLVVLRPVVQKTAPAPVGLQLRAGVAVDVQVRGPALRHRQQVQRAPLPEARHRSHQ